MKNNKEYKSTQKFLLVSPRKVRLVTGVVKKMKPAEAIEKLPFTGKRAAADLVKVIKSAIANAKTQGVSETELVFKEIQIGEGPRLKRGRSASRGRWRPFKKRMSHIRVVLKTTSSEVLNPKTESNSKKLEVKKETEITKKRKEKKS